MFVYNDSRGQVPGPSTKRLTGNGEKLTYSPAVGCNWLCLAGVYFFPLFPGCVLLTDPVCALRTQKVLVLAKGIWVKPSSSVLSSMVKHILSCAQAHSQISPYSAQGLCRWMSGMDEYCTCSFFYSFPLVAFVLLWSYPPPPPFTSPWQMLIPV